ncbi:YobA family protein [Paenibacillus radicis (ex Xue et al. 2023)]|uniref:YobA family protein n=1 Tax=Paenibacillus radicis (ex Xue et al. 2023) TaxID=2972489 RepID=A0ABT1YKZ1_9BACL|nr:YobA family protein [Paenibacillus radicis (ex Xue et al. 2023)]MCR8633861.1 YobA family protein [Paenibacillus radicis (ex Xue et al. 2023)]
MRYLMILTVLATCISGCSSSKESPAPSKQEVWNYKEGYIISKSDHKVLVVKNTKAEDISKKSVQQLLDEVKPDAAWITVKNNGEYDSLAIGDKVSIVNDGMINQSYPAQATALKISRINTK